MRKDKVIYLIGHTVSKNGHGDPIKTPNDGRRILATKKSIRQTEFYQAAATDYKPEIAFDIWTSEYKGESLLVFKGIEYNIIRTFEKNDKETELICEGLSNHG